MKTDREWKSFHPIFQYPFMRSCNLQDRDFAKAYLSILQSTKIKVEKTKVLPYLSKMLSSLISGCRILFLEDRFKDLILSLKKKNSSVGIIGGVKAGKFAFKIRVPYYPIFHWRYSLIKLFEKDPKFTSVEAQKLVRNFSLFLRRKKVEFLVLSNDSLFIERFFIFCGKLEKITTICILHGLPPDKTNSEFRDGQFADYMFLWGESQKKLYRELKMRKKIANLKVLGYPFFTETNILLDKKKVCILGQPYENYNKDLGKRKREIFKVAINLLKSAGYNVVYKPHPGELNKDFIPNNVEIYDKDLKIAFRDFGVFISLTSTALFEASLNKRIAIQIYDETFGGDHFEEKGYSYTLMKKDLASLPNMIQKLDSPFPIPQNVVYQPEDIGKRFLELLEDIREERKERNGTS